MDGLSAAASGIAVVSLAIQVADSVQKLHGFLKSIRDAPDEVYRLSSMLIQLKGIVDEVKAIAEKQEKLRHAPYCDWAMRSHDCRRGIQ